jgi:lipoprotein NlpI
MHLLFLGACLAAGLVSAVPQIEVAQKELNKKVQREIDRALGGGTTDVAELDKIIREDPLDADAYNRRGIAHFKLGHFKESLADFDRYLKLKRKAKASHWQRGITCYYAGSYEEGAKQFEAYQTYYGNDVENAVWHYLCIARKDGVKKARASILKVGNDMRVPMREIHALFSGTAKPEDVLAAAEAGKPTKQKLKEQLFYAHLYLGLYYEAEGEKKKAREHITKAAKDYKMDHYMWEVARVHSELLEKKAKEEQKKANDKRPSGQ